MLRGSKQLIMSEKKDDKRIKRINHTINLSFLDRLDKVIYGPNVSTAKFDEIIEEEKKKMLINTN